MIDALAQLVPSFQAQGFGADMANQTLQARLRGLSPNDVLVLVDGKRRHTTASLAIDGGSAYSGGAGVDLNFIPMAMVDHVEVLTDGAAAQYGSDAIAGVINFILKKNDSGGTVNATYGGFFDGGGSTTEVDANAGFAPIENSFFNITAQVSNHGHTDRGNPDPRTNPAYWEDPTTPVTAIQTVTSRSCPATPTSTTSRAMPKPTSSSWASMPASTCPAASSSTATAPTAPRTPSPTRTIAFPPR